jgi:hypothetical protein
MAGSGVEEACQEGQQSQGARGYSCHTRRRERGGRQPRPLGSKSPAACLTWSLPATWRPACSTRACSAASAACSSQLAPLSAVKRMSWGQKKGGEVRQPQLHEA